MSPGGILIAMLLMGIYWVARITMRGIVHDGAWLVDTGTAPPQLHTDTTLGVLGREPSADEHTEGLHVG